MKEIKDYDKNGLDMFNEDIDKFLDMSEDFSLLQKDYYDEFSKMCLKYLESSIVPYLLCRELIIEEYPCEKYYMQMLMEVYSFFSIGDDFLEILKQLIDGEYYKEYQKKAHEIIKEHIKDNYIVAYRGEFAVGEQGNLDYKYTLYYLK